MSIFEQISSIVSLNDLKNEKINENKDYIILFIYREGCGACDMAKPTVCDVVKNNIYKNNNCKIIKVHSIDIKDDIREIYSGSVPAFRILKKNKNNYDIIKIENINNINDNKYFYSTDGFLGNNYKDEKNNKYLSTKNTLIDLISNLNKMKIKENYTNYSNDKLNNIIYTLNSPKIQNLKSKIYVEKDNEDGSGYSIMQLCDPYVKELNKSFNKIINEKLKGFNKI